MAGNMSFLNGLTGAGLFSWTGLACFHVFVVEKSGIEQDKIRQRQNKTRKTAMERMNRTKDKANTPWTQ